MITHLISTTEFVKLINSIEIGQCDRAETFDSKIAENYGKVVRYAKFISQKPTLGMFVPVSEEGNVLEEPDKYELYLECGNNYPGKGYSISKCIKYKQAQERVLFKGWNYSEGLGSSKWIYQTKDEMYHLNYDTIENLSKYINLELTEIALKRIGL